MRDHNSYSFPLYHEKKLSQITALKLLHFAFKSGIVIVLFNATWPGLLTCSFGYVVICGLEISTLCRHFVINSRAVFPRAVVLSNRFTKETQSTEKAIKILNKALHNIYFLMFQLNSIEWVLMIVNMMNTFSDCPSCVLLFCCRLFANLTTHMLHPIYWRRLAIFMELSSFF